MKFSQFAVPAVAGLLAQGITVAGSNLPRVTGLSSNGLTNAVQWDQYSLVVRGQRLFVWYVYVGNLYMYPNSILVEYRSGEFHPWRLPVRIVVNHHH